MAVFDFDILCVIGDYKNLGKYIQWKFEDKTFDPKDFDLGYECRGKCCFKRGYVPVIWIPKFPNKPREYATLAHECLHAVMYMFEWANIPSNRSTEEVITHSMAHVINEILSKRKC